MLVAITGNTYPVKDQLKALGARWNSTTKAWMIPEDRAEEARTLVDGVALDPVSERERIHYLFDKAERCRDYPGTYFPLLGEARAALAKWRENFPAAAREEDRKNLIERAEHQEHLANGAHSYDADGWLNAEAREERAQEFLKKAAELRAQAAALGE